MNNSVHSTIGIISDTHFLDRMFSVPSTLGKWFAGVDLILHAGDVGDLRILDLLGRFAPTVAVHGNDEPEYVKRDLPEQQLVAFQGVRILVWHSHFPDPVEEMANRKGSWRPKIARIANRGQEMNAQVIVYGHTHVPIVHFCNDILIINPGALASGSFFTRQVHRSIAILKLFEDGKRESIHVDVDSGQEITLSPVRLDEEFDRLGGKYQTWIVEPDIVDAVGVIRKIAYEDVRAVFQAVTPLYQQALVDGFLRKDDYIHAIRESSEITLHDKREILNALEKH